MEQQQQTHVAYGLITGIVMVIVGLVLYYTNLAFAKGMQYITLIPFLIAVILNAMAFSKANGGYVTFGNVFGSSFKMSMIVGIILVAWAMISSNLFPEMKDKVLEMTRQELAKNPNVSEDVIEKSLSIYKNYWMLLGVATSVVTGLLWGAIFSLVGAAIAPKKGEKPFTAGDNI